MFNKKNKRKKRYTPKLLYIDTSDSVRDEKIDLNMNKKEPTEIIIDKELKKKSVEFVNKTINEAEKKVNDDDYLDKLKNETDKLLVKISNKGGQAIKKVPSLAKNILEYIKDPKTDLPLKIAAVGAIIYLLSPFDAIPDMTPIIGFLDDVAAMTFTVSFISDRINKSVKTSKDTITEVTKGISQGVTQSLDESVAKQSKIRIRQQLIITAISLGGAILIAIIALIMANIL